MSVLRVKYLIFEIFIFEFCLSVSRTTVFTHAADVAVEATAPSTNGASSRWSNWLWSSPPSEYENISNSVSTALSTELEVEGESYGEGEGMGGSLFSPSSMLSYLGVDMDYFNLAGDVFNMYYYPDSVSYMSMLTTFLKLLLFITPGGGIVQQAYFAMDMAKISFKVGSMYISGYGTVDIATAVAPDILKAMLLSRRDESNASQFTLHAGDTVDISSMNAATFLQYVDSMQFPRLSDDQENEIRGDIESVLNKYYPDTLSENRDYLVDAFEQTIKFFALFKPTQSFRESFSSEEKRINRVIQFIRGLLSSNPKKLVEKKIEKLQKIFA